jgi:hypothetical protein
LASLASAHRYRILSSSRREAGIDIFTEGRRVVYGKRRICRMPDLGQSRYTGFYLRVGACWGLKPTGSPIGVLRDHATANLKTATGFHLAAGVLVADSSPTRTESCEVESTYCLRVEFPLLTG